MSKIKKLIEVALPLDAINAASAREKSIRHGHPSTLHLWWARRPLATARAVIFASLVDAPSSHPELFPTKEEQDAERKRLFRIIERLVKWKNVNNNELFEEAYAEIKKYCGDNVPTLLDPFAGGGAIPLEAQRLGLSSVATDLNPVAVMINKAMIEIPPRFADMPPINPNDRSTMLDSKSNWHGAKGLAADVHYYGEMLKRKVYEKIGHLYPKVKHPESGEELTVIAWIWARTAKCPNPACGHEIPLVHSFELSKKKDNEIYIEPIIENETIKYEVKKGLGDIKEGTINRSGGYCLACGESIPFDYLRNAGKNGEMDSRLIAIVAESKNGRVYISPSSEQEVIAKKVLIDDDIVPNISLPKNPRDFKTPNYGLNSFRSLFTNRQLLMLSTFAETLPEIIDAANKDAVKYIKNDSISVSDGGNGSKAYSEAISIYLAFVIDKLTDYSSTICSWNANRDGLRSTFGRQAIPMVWDYAEANPFSSNSGCFNNMVEWVEKALLLLPARQQGKVFQQNASKDNGLRDIMVSTDPPYYDNIGYADLSDYFYIWLRKSLRHIYSDLFSTIQVPKKEELIADPYRINNQKKIVDKKKEAQKFFEDGMADMCKQLFHYTRNDIPITIYYAFKQQDVNEDGKSSSGWETMLSAIIKSGFMITGTWPMRTEKPGRTISNGTNALASSIVLVCRKREFSGQVCSRKNFIRQLRSELIEAVAKLQSASIAPVDMMQSAIGPGISVYSRYDQVLEADGSEMTVRTALQIINQELDTFFGGQSEGLDAESRFAVELFAQVGFDELDFGTADVLARAKNTSVASVADTGAIISGRGKVRISKREEMEQNKTDNKTTWMTLQYLAFAMEREGIRGCAKILLHILGDNESLKNLAYHMYQLSEEKHLSQEAGVYNNLVISWNEILSATEELRGQQPEQMNLLEV